MATSGRMTGNSVNIGGGPSYYFIDWQVAGQNIAGNYTAINWQAYFHYQNSDAQLDNGVANLSGTRWSNGGRVRNYSGNFSTRDVQVASGSFNIGHNNNGTQSISVSGGIDVYQTGRSQGSASWDLPTIPRNASITATSGNINDESNPYISYSNPAGGGITAWLELPNLTGATRYAQRNSYGSGNNFSLSTGERNAIRSAMANTNSTVVRYVIYTNNTGNYSTQDRTISIVNASPIFTTATYEDINSATLALTGNDQYIVQGQSTVQVNIESGDAATAQKGASMVRYTSTLNAVSTNTTYTTGAIAQTLAAGSNGASTSQILSVTATDSRGNTTTVQIPVTMIPYSAPQLTASASREDGFGDDTELDISGTISTLTIEGVDKNAVDPTDGIQYRVRELPSGTFGSWVDVANTTTDANVDPNTTPIETLDQDKSYEIEIRLTDAITSTVVTVVVPVGVSAFRIGKDSLVYNQGKRIHATLDLYPVGTVIITSVNTNPQSNLGGTWSSTTTASQSLFGMTMYGFRRVS